MTTYECINCGTSRKLTSSVAGKYCSNVCQKLSEYKNNVDNWLHGKDCGWTGKTRQLKKYVRRYLYEKYGTACQICGWDEKHPIDGAVLTEIDHVDGNSENCHENNLRILCPNCHSKTTTFRARNKASKRKR